MRILPTHNFGIRLAPALLIIVALGVTAIALAVGRGASGQTGPGLSFDVGTPSGCVEVGVGDEFEIALVITGVEELQAWEATISHDFDVVRIVEHDARILLAQGAGALFEASEPLPDNNGQHLLAVGATKAVSINGSDILATIKFGAVAAGVSIIDIPQNDFDGDGDTDQGAILQNGSTMIGDLNGDNFFDGPVQSALIAVNASCASPTEQPTDPPTPKPVTPTPSPTATPTPTPVGPTPTPTPVGPTPTPTPFGQTPTPFGQTPSPSPVGAVTVMWGDNNCSQQVSPVDSLFVLRGDAGLPTNTGDCPDMGANIEILNASPHIWGDVDCLGGMSPVDSLKLLRYDAGLIPTGTIIGCPFIGDEVIVVEG